jgi:hypothetical protein
VACAAAGRDGIAVRSDEPGYGYAPGAIPRSRAQWRAIAAPLHGAQSATHAGFDGLTEKCLSSSSMAGLKRIGTDSPSPTAGAERQSISRKSRNDLPEVGEH